MFDIILIETVQDQKTRKKIVNLFDIELGVRKLSSIDVNIVSLIFMNTLNVFLNVGKQVLNILLVWNSTSIKELVGWLYKAILVNSFPFNLSYVLVELSQVQDFNVDARFQSSSMRFLFDESPWETLSKLGPIIIINSILGNVLMEESSIACLGFKLRFSTTSTKDFIIFSCYLINSLTEITEYLVLN